MDIDAVILAGGLSTRAGGFKLEFLIGGKPLIARVIDVFLPICSNIIIVGGHSVERLYPLIRPYGSRVQLVWNKDYNKGMFTSVKTGISKVKSPYFFLTPGDYPFLTTELCKELLKEIPGIIKPSTATRGGHPLLLPRESAEEILCLLDDDNLQQYLHTKEVKRVFIKDEMLLLDIDTPEDYKKAGATIPTN